MEAVVAGVAVEDSAVAVGLEGSVVGVRVVEERVVAGERGDHGS